MTLNEEIKQIILSMNYDDLNLEEQILYLFIKEESESRSSQLDEDFEDMWQRQSEDWLIED